MLERTDRGETVIVKRRDGSKVALVGHDEWLRHDGDPLDGTYGNNIFIKLYFTLQFSGEDIGFPSMCRGGRRFVPTIEVDFETFKAITLSRETEETSEGDVVRRAMGLGARAATEKTTNTTWVSEGVEFKVGSELEHVFRDGRVVKAKVTDTGLEVAGKIYKGLSPAGVAVAGHQLNGWRFWSVRNSKGRWTLADTLRSGR